MDEFFKTLAVVGLFWLTRLWNVVWRSGVVRLNWQTRVVIPIFRKKDQRVCSNYMRIILLSLSEKNYARLLERRVHLLVEPRIQDGQQFEAIVLSWKRVE